jgi:hypothetical protein
MGFQGFRSVRGGGATASFNPDEAILLRNLVSQVAELLGADDPAEPVKQDDLEHMVGLSDNTEVPDDPVLARLLPDAYRDDAAAAGEFRRYTEHGLRAGKVAAAATVLATLPENGGRVRLTVEQAEVWLKALNDIRLALGVRLNVTEDQDEMLERMEDGGPEAAGLWVYNWLSGILETLVEALW